MKRALRLLDTAWRYRSAATKLGLPLQVGFAVNNTCNTFCQMCNVWKMKPKTGLALHQIAEVFGGSLFAKCRTVSVTGGEPTVRPDFGQIPGLLADVMPALAQVNLTSNGYATERIVASFEEFLPRLASKAIGFSVNLSIDGVGAVHNDIRGRNDAWPRLEQTLGELEKLRAILPFNLVLACTLSANNFSDARNVLEYGRRRGIYTIFRRAVSIERIENTQDFESFALTNDKNQELIEFLTETVQPYDRSYARSRYYKMLVAMLNGAERSIPCLYRKAGLFVDHKGDMFVCSVVSRPIGNALTDDAEAAYQASQATRDWLACGACKSCSHDVSLYLPFVGQVWHRVRANRTGIKR